jgi:hypothetical protein
MFVIYFFIPSYGEENFGITKVSGGNIPYFLLMYGDV